MTKKRVRFVGQKLIRVPHYTGISYNVKEWGPTLKKQTVESIWFQTKQTRNKILNILFESQAPINLNSKLRKLQ